MRGLVVAGGLFVVLAFGLAAPSESRAEACAEQTCGVPKCGQPTVRTRPDLTREVTVWCDGLTGAKLISPPANAEVSNVATEWSSLHFDIHAASDAPRWDEAVFELSGHAGSIEQRVAIEVVPNSENSAPVCTGASATQRSAGTGPVDLYMNPYCYDPDGDDFVMDGGPPGVHPDAPKHVLAGFSESNWRYRTATSDGHETATIWATDVLGARSADATLDVTVGPSVDRPPECSWSSQTVAVYSRPGATRRFPIICTDPENDPFVPFLSSPPQHGVLSPLVVTERMGGFPGDQWWIDATYVPDSTGTEPDPFTVTAHGVHGDGPPGQWEIVPQELPANTGGSCGWNSSMSTAVGVPATTNITCSDGDGDPLSADVSTAPRHGTTGPAVVTPARYGNSDIAVPYIPEPGYEGYDCMRVRVSDGNGLVFDLQIDIYVVAVPPPVALPPVPPLPPLPQLPAKEPVRVAVERILGTTAVKRVRSTRGTQVWARTELSRGDLVRYSRAAGLVVVCAKSCQIRSDATLGARGLRPARTSARDTAAAATSRQPSVLSLAVSRAERRALRRKGRARASFKVSVRPAGQPGIAIKRSIPVGR
jgi:hypothetical protein